MKKALYLPATLIFLLLLAPSVPAGSVLLEDDFDHYLMGDAPYKGSWPDGMSGSGEAWSGSGQGITWVSEGAPTEPGAGTLTPPRRIVSAPGGRTGQAFCYSELSDMDGYPNIAARFSPFTDLSEDWQISLDFYAERINAPSREGGFGVIDIRTEPYVDAEGHKGWTLISQVCVAEDNGTHTIVFVLSEAPGEKPQKISATIELARWNQLKIRGNNGKKTLTFYLNGIEAASGHYVMDRASIGSISIGDINPYGKTFIEPGSIVILDNFKFESLASKPEVKL